LPAPTIAYDLARIVGREVDTNDPLEVLALSAGFGVAMVKQVEDALIAAEVRAVERSIATAGGVESVRACLDAGLPAGIVSNNSALAISAFLARWGLLDKVKPLVGRAYLHPEWMKPNARPLNQALDGLGCLPGDTVFVGDSDTDIEVAQAVGVPCVAYANKPGKRERFTATGVAVVDSMWEVVAAIQERT
jgi:phosphoglycolate phosphatase-like HAD superfamily hydrolase